jgi:electron transfer flavoprotein beta subunit
MEILVCVKQVLDARLPIEVTDGGEVRQREVSPVFVLNPADRCALEQAVKLRDMVGPCRITAMTVGPSGARMVLEQCLARGVDAVVHLLTDGSVPLDSFAVARALSGAIDRFDLILCGDRSLDEGTSEVSSILAELLDIPQVTGVVKLTVSPQDSQVVAERRLERGYRQVVQTGLPALVAVDVSICEPRYLTRRAIRCAAAMLPGKCKIINVSSAEGSEDGPELRKVTARMPPRPRAKKTVAADEGKSAQDRIAMLLGGGASPAKASKRTNGGPQGAADEIIAFLKEKGLLS